MPFSLFRSRTQVAPRPIPAVPDGTAIWAVGDVHGRFDLLEPLVAAIVADLEASDLTRRIVVFLGDYIDRGPDSRGVLRLLAGLPAFEGIEWRFLKGNHEQAMLEFLDYPSKGARWCEYGGDSTLRSYGLRMPDLAYRTEAWERVAADLRHKLTASEKEFLESLELSVAVGGYFFSHAGARPGVPLERQSPEDLMWIRQSFLNDRNAFQQIVVHGHTPTTEVYADERRIGIDTKAYESGVLTALRLEGSTRSIMQASGLPRGPLPKQGGKDHLTMERSAVVVQTREMNPELRAVGG